MTHEVELGGDVDRVFHRLASQFLLSLDMGIRQAQLYEPENQILLDPIRKLSAFLDELMHQQPYFAFQGRDENVFINGQRVRCDGPTFLRHQQFLKLLAIRKVEGIVFHGSLDAREWAEALYSVARFKRESATPFEDAREALQKRGLWEKVELMPVDASKAPLKKVMRVQVERRSFAVRAYAKAMLLLRLYIENLDDAAHRGYYHLKLQRAVQDLVTVCLENGWRYFGLVNSKHYEEYLYNHSTNVTVLALVMGVRLGLRRQRLAELGMAAMLHDVGKAFLPKGLLSKPGAFTDEERTQMKEHPMLGVDALLRVRQYNEAMLKRIMVVCEHHEVLREGTDYHAYSRIIAVAETFDALTTHRPYRSAYLPDDAIRELIRLAGRRLDPDIVHAFVQTVGLHPAGSYVELSTGERAIVFHPHPNPKEWRAPIVRLIGPKAPLVDLSEKSGDGSYRRRIVKCLEPIAAGINVSGYLYAEA